MNKFIKTFALIAAIAMLLALVCGCAASVNDSIRSEAASSSYSRNESYDTNMIETSLEYDASAGITGIELGSSVAAGDVYESRKIIRNYDMSITTDDFDTLVNYINTKTGELGGYTLESNLSGQKPEAYGDSGRRLDITLRIPAEKASEFVSGVKELGELNSLRDYTDDVTDEYYDVDTRLSVLNEQLERLRAIMVETSELSDIIALEDRISEVMLEIESLTGTLKRYDALIDYTTVYIYIRETNSISGPAASKTVGERITNGFTESLNGVGVFFVNLFVWFVSNLPTLFVVAVVAAVVIIIARPIRKRVVQKKLERHAAQNGAVQENKEENK